ncbi:Hypothetical predicted protein [Podarcis lilfordi]|uniref:Uncharacterized protein n=1 Tax=Podarcis lilfordi TaxID=74358 RepID=A0AA35KJR7_9SAUR|nr:Hypothetical predicted protein [Podarcis lilfordi]
MHVYLLKRGKSERFLTALLKSRLSAFYFSFVLAVAWNVNWILQSNLATYSMLSSDPQHLSEISDIEPLTSAAPGHWKKQ